MSRQTTIHCDGPGCDAVKGETNRWYFTAEDNSWFSIAPAKDLEEFRQTHDLPTTLYEDVCGESCAVKRLQAWMRQRREST